MPPDDDTVIEEVSLLAQIGAGDRAAFRELYTRYSAPLFSYAVRLAGNRAEAEELLQDAFVKIWRHAADYDARKSRPFTWAFTIVRRTCIDHLRQRRATTPPASLAADPAAMERITVGESARPAAEAHEDAERLRDALTELSPDQRRALELALYSELTHTEIARRLNQPVGTVKSWIRRGLLDLRATLSEARS